MDMLAQLKDIGIALASILVFAYILKYTIDRNKEVFDTIMEQLKQNRADYSQFVETNNHSNSERIEKSTEAMTKIGMSIETHTKILEKLINKYE